MAFFHFSFPRALLFHEYVPAALLVRGEHEAVVRRLGSLGLAHACLLGGVAVRKAVWKELCPPFGGCLLDVGDEGEQNVSVGWASDWTLWVFGEKGLPARCRDDLACVRVGVGRGVTRQWCSRLEGKEARLLLLFDRPRVA